MASQALQQRTLSRKDEDPNLKWPGSCTGVACLSDVMYLSALSTICDAADWTCGVARLPLLRLLLLLRCAPPAHTSDRGKG